MNLFRLVHFGSYQRGSLAAIRYVAQGREGKLEGPPSPADSCQSKESDTGSDR